MGPPCCDKAASRLCVRRAARWILSITRRRCASLITSSRRAVNGGGESGRAEDLACLRDLVPIDDQRGLVPVRYLLASRTAIVARTRCYITEVPVM